MEVGFFSSTIVQVAVSIVISWGLFALLCSMIHEVVVRLKSERGRFYRTKITDKLFDASNQINWGLLIYNHSSIKLLSKSEKAPPAYIDSKTMAEALIDIVSNSQAAQILKYNKGVTSSTFSSELLSQFDFATTHLGQSDVIVILRKALDKAKIKSRSTNGFDEEKVYDLLTSELTYWFDQFNDRTSAWYKKLSQKRLFAVGLLVALITNVDSLTLFKYYNENPAVRVALIDYYSKNKLQLEALSAKYDTISKTTKMDSLQLIETKTEIAGLTKQLDSLKTHLELPVGWNKSAWNIFKNTSGKGNTNSKIKSKVSRLDESAAAKKVTFFGIPVSNLIYKIIGLIISAFAASVGAPFWFDVLKKATTITDTVIKKV